ncbi:hypothetical protein HK096_008911, partial [Nowakowskiella sp. JEL0078]
MISEQRNSVRTRDEKSEDVNGNVAEENLRRVCRKEESERKKVRNREICRTAKNQQRRESPRGGWKERRDPAEQKPRARRRAESENQSCTALAAAASASASAQPACVRCFGCSGSSAGIVEADHSPFVSSVSVNISCHGNPSHLRPGQGSWFLFCLTLLLFSLSFHLFVSSLPIFFLSSLLSSSLSSLSPLPAAKQAAKFDPEREMAARLWIQDVIGEQLIGDSFHIALKDGVVLC